MLGDPIGQILIIMMLRVIFHLDGTPFPQYDMLVHIAILDLTFSIFEYQKFSKRIDSSVPELSSHKIYFKSDDQPIHIRIHILLTQSVHLGCGRLGQPFVRINTQHPGRLYIRNFVTVHKLFCIIDKFMLIDDCPQSFGFLYGSIRAEAVDHYNFLRYRLNGTNTIFNILFFVFCQNNCCQIRHEFSPIPI